MVKRSFRLVKQKLHLKYKKNKYLYIYSISLIRFFPTLISKIKIQNYYNKLESTVDYLVSLKEEKLQIFMMLMNKNLTYNYDQLLNITCVDNLNFSNNETNYKFRFTLIYILNNINLTSRLAILFSFSEETVIMSISKIYKASLWLEREIYDLFGIFFFEHPDLRRILTDYGFKGFPLRKDFPLTGYVELRFSEELKSVKYQPIKLIQEYRYFDFESPWKLNDSNLMKNYEKF